MKIEDHKSIGSNSQKDARPVRGRKPKWESRSAEFRQRLSVWRQMPASSRPSLRALACELNTTHQLLSFYLKRLDKWQHKERHRKAKKESEEIRARAKAENRDLTPWEDEQVRGCGRAILRAALASALLDNLDSIKQDARRRPLNWHQIQMLKRYAREGYPGAKELLQRCSQKGSGDKTPKDYREDFEGVWVKCTSFPHPPRESEKPRLARRYERWRASLEAQELLQKHSQGAPDDN